MNQQTTGNEKKVSSLIEQYRQRPILPVQEQQARRWALGQTNHIAACEGYTETEFNRLLDELYIKGQITPDEMTELYNLKYL